MTFRVMVLAAGLVVSALSVGTAGTFKAKVEGERNFTSRLTQFYLDEVTGAYGFAACRPVNRRESCSRDFLVLFRLPDEGTGAAQCGYMRYITRAAPDFLTEVGWATFEGFGGGCSVEVRKVVRDDLGRVKRIRGTFSGIVSPSSDQGGPDLTIDGTFRGPLFPGIGE
jgi:hypothetical protein